MFPWTLTVEEAECGGEAVERALKDLPYRFRDPVKVKRTRDPRAKRFGSRVDARPAEKRETYARVKKVLSPNQVVLDSGRRLRLLGVKVLPRTRKAAEAFLEEKTASSPVYWKTDETREDGGDPLPCYLYLKNRTFLNLHLIQRGLAGVDTSLRFKYCERFLRKVPKGGRTGEEA
jgi:site-specific DNA-methyltransferase (adenine-specific)